MYHIHKYTVFRIPDQMPHRFANSYAYVLNFHAWLQLWPEFLLHDAVLFNLENKCVNVIVQ